MNATGVMTESEIWCDRGPIRTRVYVDDFRIRRQLGGALVMGSNSSTDKIAVFPPGAFDGSQNMARACRLVGAQPG